jgi:transposase
MSLPTNHTPETLMLASIPDGPWQVDANDPTALTRLLDLPGLRVTRLEYNDLQHQLHVFCQHTTQLAWCPTCQHPSTAVHQYRQRALRDLPWAGKLCLLELVTRRFWCETCQCPFREELDWLARNSRLTRRYRQFVFAQCRRTSLQAVHHQERLGYKTVERLYYDLAAQEPQTAAAPAVRKLGIDEFALKKGHDQFALALSNLETGSVITVLADRKKETLEAHFATWTKQQREAVTEVAMDLWEPYAQAVAAYLPHAAIVADRFHVMKHLNDQVSAARRDLQRDLPEEAKQTLKGCRWLLVRNEVDLSPADKAKLQRMFVQAPALGQLHALKEDFRAIFETEADREGAKARLERWMTTVETSGLTKLTKFVGTLRRRFEHILNYFPHRLTSGMVEGLNNKVKVIKRCAYGFRNFAHFALRIQIECDGAT